MKNYSPFSRWLQLCFVNLLFVALLGVVMRYKIAYSLPFVEQRYLLHGHSHFAFAGWLTQILMVLIVRYFSTFLGDKVWKEYRWLLYGNCITAYGMLIFFPIQGYAFASICFSTLSIFVSYFFAVKCWKDCNRVGDQTVTKLWIKAALIFLALSSLGAFSLAFMMAKKIMMQRAYLAAVYFFLHFQYNGWFFFASMGLFTARLESIGISVKKLKWTFWMFGAACIPAYFLSALWMPIPVVVYVIVVLSAVAQCTGWFLLVSEIWRKKIFNSQQIKGTAKSMIVLAAVALTIKLLLQLGSTHPSLSQIAFGFRPIVIGYLHLVLLGVITIFLIGYTMWQASATFTTIQLTGIWIFVGGIIINEILLMLQGVTAMDYVPLPKINEYLLVAASVMFTGVLVFNISFRKKIF